LDIAKQQRYVRRRDLRESLNGNPNPVNNQLQ
jgi:hypothetical protein